MEPLVIDRERMIFLRGGKPFFYLADTAWMAFSSLSLDDWERYLDYRWMQRFTAVQISILPILNDFSSGTNTLMPYAFGKQGKMDFRKINHHYFDKARAMTGLAAVRGIKPSLVVLWNNYVPTAWAAEKTGNVSVMDEDYLEAYAAHITDLFGEYDPVYIISGDTGFETETVVRYYSGLLDFVKKRSPSSLTAFHLNPSASIPESVMNNRNLDFYMYQSGHGGKDTDLPWMLAEKFSGSAVRRPVVNGEPCYEGHAHGNEYPRFGSFDVRRAVWQSLLSGAKAGTAYGAHGVWMFQQEGMAFTSASFSGHPFLWQDALRFEGARDMGYARWIFETYNLFDIEPNQNLIEAPKEIRAASKRDLSLIAVYMPCAFPFTILEDLSDYEMTIFLLGSRTEMTPSVFFDNGKSMLKMIPFNEDALLIAKR